MIDWVLEVSQMPNRLLEYHRNGTQLKLPPEELPGYKGARVACAQCGEGIQFGREVVRDGAAVCRGCAGERYWEPV